MLKLKDSAGVVVAVATEVVNNGDRLPEENEVTVPPEGIVDRIAGKTVAVSSFTVPVVIIGFGVLVMPYPCEILVTVPLPLPINGFHINPLW